MDIEGIPEEEETQCADGLWDYYEVHKNEVEDVACCNGPMCSRFLKRLSASTFMSSQESLHAGQYTAKMGMG